MNQRKRQVVGLACLLLFAIYWCGITCFTHSHVENGVVIVHSHPFQDAHHTHTDAQFETIFCLTHFYSLECSTFIFECAALFVLLFALYIIRSVSLDLLGKRNVLSLRAPPAVRCAVCF